jgi:bifunctional ADP-heptose synthase (sugar kinase/adenylyltransferase)
MLMTGYPSSNLIFVQGKVEETLPRVIPDNISLLRLDTDWYESTRHELIHLFPLLSKSGVLVLDDYGYWAGARKAVDEYVVENNIKILLDRVDGTGRVGLKN